jgi:hypothetical protein
VHDGNGHVTSFVFAFAAAGSQEPTGPTIRDYRENFRTLTPDAPSDWKIHHTRQVLRHDGDRILETRYLEEQGINIHKEDYLRAVPDKVHDEITTRQQDWWKKWAREHNVSVEQAYWKAPLAEYDEFAQRMEAEYSDWWLTHGSDASGSKARNVARIKNTLENNLSEFTADKAARKNRLGFAVGSLALFTLLADNAKAAANIASHTPTQLAKWNALEQQMETALTESEELGRVRWGTGVNLKNAWREYWLSLEIDTSTVNKVDAVIGAYVDANLEP